MSTCNATSYFLLVILALARCGQNNAFLQGHTLSNGPVWIMDTTDRKCMGVNGFEPCSSRTVWSIHGVPEDYRVEHSHPHSISPIKAKDWLSARNNGQPKCLYRESCYTRTSSLSLGACGRCGGSKWHLTAAGALTHKNRTCVGRNGDFAFLQSCDDGHVVFSIVPPSEYTQSHPSLASLSSQTLSGHLIEQTTNLRLPFNLQTASSTANVGSTHILIGAGVFTRTLLQIPVYAMGWYVEYPAVSSAPNLRALRESALSSTARLENVHRAMVEPGGYDRSLLMKLAISLPQAMLQEGLIETLAVHQEYAHIFTELCHQHLGGTASHAREWNRGAELVFTWRKSGVLEIWADGQLLETIDNPGLAQTLFWQFVNEDPVSPQAKDAFAEGLLDVLQGKIPRGTIGTTASTVHSAIQTADRMLAEKITLAVTLVLGLVILMCMKASYLPRISFKMYDFPSP